MTNGVTRTRIDDPPVAVAAPTQLGVLTVDHGVGAQVERRTLRDPAQPHVRLFQRENPIRFGRHFLQHARR